MVTRAEGRVSVRKVALRRVGAESEVRGYIHSFVRREGIVALVSIDGACEAVTSRWVTNLQVHKSRPRRSRF